jgi:hypothetical protein
MIELVADSKIAPTPILRSFTGRDDAPRHEPSQGATMDVKPWFVVGTRRKRYFL